MLRQFTGGFTSARTIFDQPDAGEVRAQLARPVDTIGSNHPVQRRIWTMPAKT